MTLQARYIGGVAPYSDAHRVWINPKTVAHFAWVDIAFDLLLMAGFATFKMGGSAQKLVDFEISQNQ